MRASTGSFCSFGVFFLFCFFSGFVVYGRLKNGVFEMYVRFGECFSRWRIWFVVVINLCEMDVVCNMYGLLIL